MRPDRDVEVVHRDPHVIVVVKPPGLPTTSPPEGSECLVDVVRGLDPAAPRLHPSSRLDAEVSGLVVFARTRRAIRGLLAARRQGRYGRLYMALAPSPPQPEHGCWDGPIGLDPRDPRRRVVATDPSVRGAKSARTGYELAAVRPGACVLRLRPRTGRTHQLRVHAAAAGVPLVGDVHYGGARRLVCKDGRVLTARRTMLHCTALRIPDFVGDGQALYESRPADDMRELWNGLGGHPAALEPVAP